MSRPEDWEIRSGVAFLRSPNRIVVIDTLLCPLSPLILRENVAAVWEALAAPASERSNFVAHLAPTYVEQAIRQFAERDLLRRTKDEK